MKKKRKIVNNKYKQKYDKENKIEFKLFEIWKVSY